MPEPERLLLGEFRRSLDERYRLSIPGELMDQLGIAQTGLAQSGSAQSGIEPGEGPEADFTLAKERPGCLSLWLDETWKKKLRDGTDVVRSKLRAGKLENQLGELQRLGRLLSTRHKQVQIAGRGRLLVPEGFREFLRVEPGGDVMVVGAAVCIEIWQPAAWVEYLDHRMPAFRKLFDKLSG
jgi:MraZ protein